MPTVLIVDDSPSMRALLTDALEKGKHSVVQATDGVQALLAVEDNQFDLVITDVNMPNMDGITLLGKLRKHSRTKFTPILLLTTETDFAKKKQAKELGATGWLNKPVDDSKLLMTVRRVLE
jgi:two-component system chemotaxis response regulator CheY